jgi:hypothetical protein
MGELISCTMNWYLAKRRSLCNCRYEDDHKNGEGFRQTYTLVYELKQSFDIMSLLEEGVGILCIRTAPLTPPLGDTERLFSLTRQAAAL